MSILLIGYDFHPSAGRSYKELEDDIKTLGSWWHILDSTWLVKYAKSAAEVRDKLQEHFKDKDKLMVFDITDSSFAATGFNGELKSWLAS